MVETTAREKDSHQEKTTFTQPAEQFLQKADIIKPMILSSKYHSLDTKFVQCDPTLGTP